MNDAKEEVRSRLNIEDVVSEYVQLKRAGRNFKGLSPFTSEKTPSFVVSPDKHIWHDFSSGKGGDVFSFVMEVEGIDFRETLERLARKAGVDLSQYNSRESGETAKRKKRLLEANELAARYYQQALLRNQHALEYVFKIRGLSKEIVQEFRIGYAPSDGNALVSALEKRGFSKKEIADAGLTNRFGGDIFRGRMTVPLMDGGGQVIGFTGRIITNDPNAPKYLNTPQTLLYDKSRHVFALSQAKEAIRKSDDTVLVEGNLDVVSSHQAGVKNVVATAGTALTEWQLKALSRLSSHIKLAFDGDKAGIAATERAIPIAERVGVTLQVISLPDSAKDPDELIKQDVKLWLDAIKHSVPAIDWVIDQYSKREDLTSAQGKRIFTTKSLEMLRGLKDKVEVEHYQQIVAEKTSTSLTTIVRKSEELVDEEEQPRLKPIKQTDTPQAETDNYNSIQDSVLAVLWTWPDTRELLADVEPNSFTGDARQAVAAFLKAHPDALTNPLPQELQSFETYVKIVELRAETRYEAWTPEERIGEAARLLRQMITETKNQTKTKLLEKLRDAEQGGDDIAADELRKELYQLIKETAT